MTLFIRLNAIISQMMKHPIWPNRVDEGRIWTHMASLWDSCSQDYIEPSFNRRRHATVSVYNWGNYTRNASICICFKFLRHLKSPSEPTVRLCGFCWVSTLPERENKISVTWEVRSLSPLRQVISGNFNFIHLVTSESLFLVSSLEVKLHA